MPNGFSGRAATRYLSDVSTANANAANATAQAAPRASAGMNARKLPFTPAEGRRGGFTTGKGNSSNIVSDSGAYDQIANRISQIDDRIGECLYKIAVEIEEMCQTSYRLPQTVTGCMNIAATVKNSLGEFRGLTEDAASITRNFARDIENIGGA